MEREGVRQVFNICCFLFMAPDCLKCRAGGHVCVGSSFHFPPFSLCCGCWSGGGGDATVSLHVCVCVCACMCVSSSDSPLPLISLPPLCFLTSSTLQSWQAARSNHQLLHYSLVESSPILHTHTHSLSAKLYGNHAVIFLFAPPPHVAVDSGEDAYLKKHFSWQKNQTMDRAGGVHGETGWLGLCLCWF